MAIDVVVGVRLDRSGVPELFKIAHFTGSEISATGPSRIETRSWLVAAVQGGAKIDTLINTDGHAALTGYVTVSVDSTGDDVLGIDDRNNLGRKIKDLPRF
ncbi:hypothetical protein [Pseudomonas fluorescens group sp. PF-69]